jgi:hypothetical protein
LTENRLFVSQKGEKMLDAIVGVLEALLEWIPIGFGFSTGFYLARKVWAYVGDVVGLN